jgi:pimeloyl-ACP methyl ester carboxylesterase
MFANLRLPQGYHAVHLEWFTPMKKETLQGYARRIGELIPEKDPILVGLSFGGVMAQEVSRVRPVKKLILISTMKSRREMPRAYKIGSMLRLQYLFGKWMLVAPKFISYYIFGVNKPPARKLLDKVLDDLHPVFLRWAIRKGAYWNPPPLTVPFYHIHGRQDRILPIRYIKADQVMDGGHLIVMTHAREVSEAVAAQLPPV